MNIAYRSFWWCLRKLPIACWHNLQFYRTDFIFCFFFTLTLHEEKVASSTFPIQRLKLQCFSASNTRHLRGNAKWKAVRHQGFSFGTGLPDRWMSWSWFRKVSFKKDRNSQLLAQNTTNGTHYGCEHEHALVCMNGTWVDCTEKHNRQPFSGSSSNKSQHHWTRRRLIYNQ